MIKMTVKFNHDKGFFKYGLLGDLIKELERLKIPVPDDIVGQLAFNWSYQIIHIRKGRKIKVWFLNENYLDDTLRI